MSSLFSLPAPATTKMLPREAPLSVPRLNSLHHRLRHARDASGQRIPLLDELLFFLDEPPCGTTDRWQQGADLCGSHGIPTSRMSVWRFYRSHISQWRRESNPPPPAPPVDPAEIERLDDQARYVGAQRLLEMLNDPDLSPGHLICFLQADNQRRKLQLARDQLDHRIDTRRLEAQREHAGQLEERARRKALFSASRESEPTIFQMPTSLPLRPAA